MAFFGSKNSPLVALWEVDANQATALVLRALRDHKGNLRDTALTLRIGRTTLTRWTQQKPALKSGLRQIRIDIRTKREQDRAREQLRMAK